ncbi:MAG TPA: DUF2934 domain-containing protein [Terriglobia bacterium]|nr:DUF2934 domain-containing protein [Terriglobia bacterium]
MIVSRVEKRPKLNKKVDAPVIAPAVETTTAKIPTSQDAIRERAYQMYQKRGSKDGHDMQDWLRAERQILKH